MKRLPAWAKPSARPSPPHSAWGFAWVGAVLGLLTSLLVFAPATWLAAAVREASQGHVVLAGAQGTVWRGSAQLEFGGGAGSRDLTALPGVLHWRLWPGWQGLQLRLNAPCCTPQDLQAQVAPGWGAVTVRIADGQSNWPAALLSGLGTPWNTLQPVGELQLATQGLRIDLAQGRLALSGGATLDALRMSSRLSTLRPMGSYRLRLSGGAVSQLQLETLEGALRLSGSGQWAGARLHFEGFAVAEPEREAALANLLNIIGRRDGARSIITVG